MLSKAVSAADAVGVRNLIDINTALSICIGGITLGSQLKNMFSGKPNEIISHEIQKERESASQLFTAANNCYQVGHYGEALDLIDRAIKDITRSKAEELEELESSKLVFAELYRFKGIVLFYLKDYESAVETLNTSLKYSDKQTLVLNLLAFIYLNHFPDLNDRALLYLIKSIKSDPNQIFARLYIEIEKDNLVAANKIVYELQQIAAAEKDSGPQELSQRFEIKNKAASMLDIFLPYMLAAWLDLNTKMISDPNKLCHIAAICHGLVEKYQTMQWKGISCLLESKIKIFTKLSDIKSFGTRYSAQDKEWIKAYTFPLPLDDGKARPFFECNANSIDRSITKYFPTGLNTNFLKTEELRYALANVMIGWAKSSYFYEDMHPEMVELKRLCKEERKGIYHELELKNAALSLTLIQHFVDTYITDRGIEPWLRYYDSENAKPALLYLLCEENNIEIRVYKLTDNSSLQLEPKLSLQFIESDPSGRINLLHKDEEFSILHSMERGVTKLYQLIAHTAANKILENNPNSELAWQTLANRGALITEVWQLPHASGTETNASPRLFQTNALRYLSTRTKHCQDKGKNENQHESARIRLLTILSHLQQHKIVNFNIQDEINKLYHCDQQPFVEIAQVLHLRLILQGIYKKNKTSREKFLQHVIFQFSRLKQFEAKLLAELVLAEFQLLGDRRQTNNLLHRPKLMSDGITALLKYLRLSNIIKWNVEEVSPDDFKAYLAQDNKTVLLDYCHGFAAYLLSLTCDNKTTFEAYQNICVRLGYQKEPKNLNELVCQLMGLPLEAEVTNHSMQKDRFEHYKSAIAYELKKLIYRSRLMAPVSVIVDCAVTSATSSGYALLDKWFTKLQHYIYKKDMHKLYRVLMVIEQQKLPFDFKISHFDFNKYEDHEKYKLLNDLYYLHSQRLEANPAFHSISEIVGLITQPRVRSISLIN